MALPKSTKKKKPRAAPRVQRGAKLTEPNWDGWEEWTGEQIHKHRRATNSWYYEHFKPEDLYANVYVWMEKEDKYTKDQMKWIKAAPKHAISVTAGIVARMDTMGAPRFSQKEADHWESLAGTMGQLSSHIDFLERRIEIAIQAGKESKEEKEEELKEKPQKRVISIQERIELQAIAACEKIDTWLEVWSEKDNKFDPKGFDFAKHFVQMKITQAHARKIKTMYDNELNDYNDLDRMPTAGQLKKMSEHDADMWAQLKEGYAHLKKSHIKDFRSAINLLMTELDFIIEQAKVPVLVDAGVGSASDAAVAMELGCDGVLMNSAIAGAKDPIRMAKAMNLAILAGRESYLAGPIPRKFISSPSSPMTNLV